MNHYLCSVGSNIAPEHNVADVIAELSSQFGMVTFSPLIRTAPTKMASTNWFINGLFSFASELPPQVVKATFNHLEAQHGRDRSDPDSSIKDRPLDLDILACQPQPDFAGIAIDSFLQVLLPCMMDPQHRPHGVALVPLELGGLQIGKTTTSVDLDAVAGHVVV